MNRILSLLVLITFISWPSYGLAQSSSKIGVVDGERLFDEFPSAQDATKKIADAQDELKDTISETEKIYSEFEKQKKSDSEKLTKKKELQAKIDLKAQETKKMIETLSTQIENDILQAIKKIAGEKGLDVILDKRAVLVGGTDITDSVSLQLKKKAPLANGDPANINQLKK
ncbi:MAG: OmpH family outer membrane protein [Candidatus Melainabacteria bacterium]|nr:OmpH family outer membrane protein [Candidatus Melainabacteria bacterium]